MFLQNLLSLQDNTKKQEALEQRLSEIEEENETAKENLEYLQSDKALEIEARDKLNLKKAGESVFVIYPSTISKREPLSDEDFLKKYDKQYQATQKENEQKDTEDKKSFLEKVQSVLSIVVPKKTQNVKE